MNILFVTNDYPTLERPGSSPCIAEQRRALEALGHHVAIAHVEGRQSRLNYIRGAWNVLGRSVGFTDGKELDVIHAHYGYSGLVARCQMRWPVVVTFRGSDVLNPIERPWSRLAAAIADVSIVMTAEMRAALGDANAHIIPYGVDFDLFQPSSQEDCRKDLGLPNDKPLVLFPYDPGRPEKRFDLIEQAIAILHERIPDAEIVTLYNEAHERVAKYMNACDVMVLASDTEGSPVAVQEAMACNLPIVSVDVGDVARVIGDVDGCYVCERNPYDMADKLVAVITDRERTQGREAVTHLSTAAAACRLSDIYSGLLANRLRQGAGDKASQLP